MALACAAPSEDLGLVQGLLTSVDCNVRGLVETGYGVLASPGSQMSAVLTALLTLYVAFLGMRLMLGIAPLRVGDLTVTIVKIAVVLALATSWPTYQQLVFGVLFQGPEEIAGSVLTSVQPSNSVFRGNPFNGLQLAYDEMQVQAAFFAQRSNTMTSPLVGGNAFGAFALNISAFIMLMSTMGVVLAVKIILGLLLALGPVFVALLLFDSTRGVFEGWLRASLAFAFAPLFVILALVVQLILIEPHLARMAEMRAIGEIDLAPAIAVLTLTLISASVSLAGLFAVGMIANGLRLGSRSGRESQTQRVETQSHSDAAQAEAASRAPAVEVQSRVASIASAAAAMDRRDRRLDLVGADAPQRLTLVSSAPAKGVDAAFQPTGQTYRRSAQPRRAASSARRDR